LRETASGAEISGKGEFLKNESIATPLLPEYSAKTFASPEDNQIL